MDKVQKPKAPKRVKIATLIFALGPTPVFVWGVYQFWGEGVDFVSLSLFVTFCLITEFGVTAGFHRLFTHRSYETSMWVQVVLAIMGSMAAQNSFFQWVADHRIHHQHSDQEGDPHSPHHSGKGLRGFIRGFYHAHMGWLFETRYNPEVVQRNTVLINNKPALIFVNKLFPLWVALGLLVPALIGGVVSLSWKGALLGFLWGGVIRLFWVYHVTWSVNSVCHLFGRRRFKDTEDFSTNNPLVALLSLGEGWHNNHHGIQRSARHGMTWWELDPTWWMLLVLGHLGLVWNMQEPKFTNANGSEYHMFTRFPKKEVIVQKK